MDVDISISVELLMLLEWLTKNERNLLDSIVKNSLKNGLSSRLNDINDLENDELAERFYPTIIDFLLTIESCLIENMQREEERTFTDQDFLPVIKKISFTDINLKTIYQSTNQANKKIKSYKNKKADSQKILIEQLLKNWKPNKKDASN